MLTKDLLRVKAGGKSLTPRFVDVASPGLLDLAARLLSCYVCAEDGSPVPLKEISESVEEVGGGYPDLKLLRGLDKILRDRCGFSSPEACDYVEPRAGLFAASGEVLRTLEPGTDEAAFREAVLGGMQSEARAFVDGGIYADLPGNELLLESPKLSPRELLERYNCALAQSLLLYSADIELEIEDPEAAKMRRLCKYLKFFRLLARISRVGTGGRLRVTVDGPASMFENTQKYGLQLACFFPAVLDMARWSLKTRVKPYGRELDLKLDQESGLTGHYRNFSAYVPEEVAMFHRLFKEKVEDWRVVGGDALSQEGSNELIFPDLSFCSISGQLLHLELFHRWHATALLQRLEYCEKHPGIPLVIGVDRALHRRPEILARLEESEYFQQSGFLFRDFPGVDRVRKLLDGKRAGS